MDKAGFGVVLGCSEGTGAATARALAEHAGLNVFGFHRGNHPEAAAELGAAIEAAGRRYYESIGDAGTYEAAQAGADAVLQAAGPRSVKMMVHSIANASLGRFSGVGNMALHPKQIAKTFDSMAHSFVYWVEALRSRDLLAPRAHLLGLTNPIPDAIVDGMGLISATKQALEIYVRHLAFELGPLGHRVNLLKFGLVETRAVIRVVSEERWSTLKARVEERTPYRRLATVEEVGRFIAILCDDATAWFNGAVIDFSGVQNESLLDSYFNRPKGEW